MRAIHVYIPLFYAFLGCALSVGALAAQEQRRDQHPSAASVMARSFTMGRADDVLSAVGPRYKARFDADSVVYTPALGAAAPHNMSVRFELVSIRRGAVTVLDGAAARSGEPRHAGMQATYERGRGVSEVYEARADGLKQSFVFADEPAGAGDLVVEMRLSTDLPIPSVALGPHGVRLEEPGVGGVVLDAVVGVDASGRRAAGSMATDGDVVRFVLPERFVSTAAYPLVLDPLIGTAVAVDFATNGGEPDIAYDAETDLYLIVWEYWYSGQDADIVGRLVDANGAWAGPFRIFEGSTDFATSPTVASVDSGSRSFFVAWQEGASALGAWSISGRSVDATGALSPAVSVAFSFFENYTDPDASGDNSGASGLDDDGVIITFVAPSGVQAVKVDVSSSSVVAGPVAVSSVSTDSAPSISKSGGASRRHMIVWEREVSGRREVHARLIDRDLNMLGPSVAVADAATDDTFGPDVDGDGASWWVLYQQRESGLSGPADIYCRRVVWAGAGIANAGPAEAVAATPGVDERDPAVGNLGARVLVAWASGSFGGAAPTYSIHTAALDPQTCLSCLPSESILGTLELFDFEPAVATRWSGRASIDPISEGQAALAWTNFAFTFPLAGTILFHAYEAYSGAVANLGGACGIAGTVGADGPVAVGGGGLTLTASGMSSDLLLVSVMTQDLPIVCGVCQFNSDLNSYLFVPGAGGSSSLPLPIPCMQSLVGTNLYAQWASVFSGINACPLVPAGLGVSFSDRLRLTIGG